MDVMTAANRRAAQGLPVFHLEVGEPGGGTPAAALAAARDALAGPSLGYTEALGIAPLRRRIAQHYRETYGLDVAVERIAVTPGASGAFLLAFLAAFDAGDVVALAEPGYPAYRTILETLGVQVAAVQATVAERFQPTPENLGALTQAPRGLVLASPANPTGSMLNETAMRRLVAWAAARQVRIISDEIYHGIVYGAPATSILAIAPDAIVVNSFSKFFCMTGWRLGWLVLPEALVEPVTRLAQNLFIASSTVAQYAALGVFDATAELRARVAGYRSNRDRLLDALASADIDRVAPPDGAFYLYADIGHLTQDSAAFARRLLDETGVAVTPGVDFDRRRGGAFVRLSFAGDAATVGEAGQRLAAWCRTRGR
jgi:aspartate/methionine/tyrosine aminotransferase